MNTGSSFASYDGEHDTGTRPSMHLRSTSPIHAPSIGAPPPSRKKTAAGPMVVPADNDPPPPPPAPLSSAGSASPGQNPGGTSGLFRQVQEPLVLLNFRVRTNQTLMDCSAAPSCTASANDACFLTVRSFFPRLYIPPHRVGAVFRFYLAVNPTPSSTVWCNVGTLPCNPEYVMAQLHAEVTKRERPVFLGLVRHFQCFDTKKATVWAPHTNGVPVFIRVCCAFHNNSNLTKNG